MSGGRSVTLRHGMTRPDNGGDVRHAADWRVTGLGNEQSEGKHARPIGCGLGGGPVYSEYLGELLSQQARQ